MAKNTSSKARLTATTAVTATARSNYDGSEQALAFKFAELAISNFTEGHKANELGKANTITALVNAHLANIFGAIRDSANNIIDLSKYYALEAGNKEQRKVTDSYMVAILHHLFKFPLHVKLDKDGNHNGIDTSKIQEGTYIPASLKNAIRGAAIEVAYILKMHQTNLEKPTVGALPVFATVTQEDIDAIKATEGADNSKAVRAKLAKMAIGNLKVRGDLVVRRHKKDKDGKLDGYTSSVQLIIDQMAGIERAAPHEVSLLKRTWFILGCAKVRQLEYHPGTVSIGFASLDELSKVSAEVLFRTKKERKAQQTTVALAPDAAIAAATREQLLKGIVAKLDGTLGEGQVPLMQNVVEAISNCSLIPVVQGLAACLALWDYKASQPTDSEIQVLKALYDNIEHCFAECKVTMEEPAKLTGPSPRPRQAASA